MATKKILVIKHGALGDVLRTSYLLPGLIEKHPGAEISWVTRSSAQDLIRFNPHVRRIFLSEGSGEVAEGEELRAQEWDLVLSFDDEPESFGLVSGLKGRELVGSYPAPQGPAYTESARPWFDMGLISRLGKEEADRLKRENTLGHAEIFGRMLGVEVKAPAFYNSSLVEGMDKDWDPEFFHVGLNLSAGPRWPAKALRLAEAQKLVAGLLELPTDPPLAVHLLGGEADLPYNQALAKGWAGEGRVALLEPRSLLGFAAFIKRLGLLITSDTLALHLAISQGVRSVSFFAPTSAAEIDTFGTGTKVLSLSPDYCSYQPDADNSTLTAQRLLMALRDVISAGV